jgi:hypothetical protein
VHFTGATTKASAGNSKNYALVDAGSPHIFGGKGNTAVTVKGVTYSPATELAQIKLAKPVSTKDSLRLTINTQPPSGLQGTNGQLVNESSSGKAGANTMIQLGAPPKQPPPPKPPKSSTPPENSKKTVAKAFVDPSCSRGKLRSGGPAPCNDEPA